MTFFRKIDVSLPSFFVTKRYNKEVWQFIEISATKMKRISIGNQILTKKLERERGHGCVTRDAFPTFSWF